MTKCEPSDSETIHTCATVMKLISGVVSLGVVLVLGSYGYTWSESKGEQVEKREWRQEHQRVLDKRFDELKRGQEKLEMTIERNTSSVEAMLQEILNEQKRVSDNVKSFNKNNKGGK